MPVLLIAIALVSVLAVAADQMTRAYTPTSDIGFGNYEARGLPLVMRTALMLTVGVAVGAVIGRLLPALLVGIGLSLAVSVGLGAVLPKWVPSAELTGPETALFGPGPLRTGVQYRLPGGEVVSAQEGEILMSQLYEDAAGEEPDSAQMPEQILYGIAAERYPEVLLRESAVLAAATVGVAAVAAAIVRRRRPE